MICNLCMLLPIVTTGLQLNISCPPPGVATTSLRIGFAPYTVEELLYEFSQVVIAVMSQDHQG